ncbi:MAG TPA: histidine phosphatase family protein, partial [Micrococcus luteus]|nr:histidine phosphatase family protein [Micrococcus luteus]
MQTLATVHLVRHGEVHNPDRVLYGRLPEFGLSELGHEMARGVAAWFEERAAQTGRAPAVVAASPLTRAQQTAAPIAAAFDLPLVTEPDLIEAENAFEGMSQVAASLKRNPRLWPQLRNPLRP